MKSGKQYQTIYCKTQLLIFQKQPANMENHNLEATQTRWNLRLELHPQNYMVVAQVLSASFGTSTGIQSVQCSYSAVFGIDTQNNGHSGYESPSDMDWHGLVLKNHGC